MSPIPDTSFPPEDALDGPILGMSPSQQLQWPFHRSPQSPSWGSRPMVKTKSLTNHSLYDSIVHIKVGPSAQDFGIHKALLCHVSPYFNAALTGKFIEANGVVILDDENPKTFQLFNGWLYTQVIFQDDELDFQNCFNPLLNLYEFGEKRLISTLQNAVIDTMIRVLSNSKTSPGANQIREIWERTTESSKLRKVMIDEFIYRTELKGIFDNKADSYPPSFWTGMAKEYHEVLGGPKEEDVYRLRKFRMFDIWKTRCARYHIHGPTDSTC